MSKIKFNVKESEKWSVLLFELENVLVPGDLQSVNPPKLHEMEMELQRLLLFSPLKK